MSKQATTVGEPLHNYQVAAGSKWTVDVGGGKSEVQRGPLLVKLRPPEAQHWVKVGRLIPINTNGNAVSDHVARLEKAGLSNSVVSRLAANGFDTLTKLKDASRDEILAIDGIGEKALLKIMDAMEASG